MSIAVTQRAVVCDRYGSPDVLQLRDVPRALPGKGEVLVRVAAVSVNDWDWGLLQGASFADRLMFGLFKPRYPVLGSDVAGHVEAVGPEVQTLKPGDEVFGDLSGRWGGFAEYVCATETSLVRKPEGMSFAQAAAIPQAGMLALQGLKDFGNIPAGSKVLVNGAGGGVGTFAIQLARLRGLHCTGLDSAGKLELMRSMGYDKVIDYARQDFTRASELYDYILDAKTNRPLSHYLGVLAPGGKYVTVGGNLGRLLQVALMRRIVPRLYGKQAHLVVLKPNRDLAALANLHEAGEFTPVIEHFQKLDSVPDAMRHFGSGRHKGKVVVTL